MKFTAIAAAAFVGAVAATSNGTEVTVTETVSSYVTYCPLPTTIVENNHTYIVTEPTTLTITDCPCTRTKTYTTITTSTCDDACPGAPTDGPVVSYPNSTVVVPTGAPVPPSNATATPAPPPPFEGAASRATIAGGALAGIVGIVAYLL